MFKNYFKTTFRALYKNKTYALINISGLALGIVCALAIFLIIRFELNFDTYHQDSERIFRVVKTTDAFGETFYGPGMPYPLPTAMRNDFPEIEQISIVDNNMGAPVISVERNGDISRYKEDDNVVAFVEADYFRIFNYNWLYGNSETVLDNPNAVVISGALAQKYFGDENPIGKRLTFNNRLPLQVTGVIENLPQNTDLPFTMLIAYDPTVRGNDNWGSMATSVQCYLKLPDNLNPQQLESRFADFFLKYREKEEAEKIKLSLQPLRELHFDTRFEIFTHRTVARETLFALSLIGLFLLVTACINFINLNTALAVKRSKEVGVRKVLGSSRFQLIQHFLGETAIITFLAIIVSVALAEIAFAQLENILEYRLQLDFFGETAAIIFLAVLFGLVTLSAGFYPALHLSRFSPTQAIRNKITANYGEGLSLRKGLVVLQFAISQVLIICTIIIGGQISYFQKAEMGFNKEAVVEVELPKNDQTKLQRLKNQLLRHSAIRYVSFSNTGTASSSTWGGNYHFKGIKKGYGQIKFIDQNFIEVYELQLLLGENLTADTLKSFLVNEAFAKEVGVPYPDLLGENVKIWGREAPIAGIVKDFNTTSLHNKVRPLLIMLQNRYWKAGIKIHMQNTNSTLEAIESAWLSVFPEFVFEYSFLDDSIERFYDEEQRTARLINTFTIIAIIIGCLGLFGLVSYMAAQRTKEIGVRKVLGASFVNILTLLSKEFAVLIFMAFIFAAPIAYYFMNSWLEDFAYKIDLGFGLFFIAFAVSILISLLTVGYKSIRAARSNPIEALRYE